MSSKKKYIEEKEPSEEIGTEQKIFQNIAIMMPFQPDLTYRRPGLNNVYAFLVPKTVLKHKN